MKTKVFNFGGGIITGMFLFLFLPVSFETKESGFETRFAGSLIPVDRPQKTKFREVPIKEFYKDVARYKGTHVKGVVGDMPQNVSAPFSAPGRLIIKKKPSRMFLYSVSTLEDFLELIKRYGRQAQLKPEKLGIRFYYGVYPQGQDIARQDYSSLHTLFMVPNYWSEEAQQYKDIGMRQLAEAVKKAHGYGNNDKEEFIKSYYLENMFPRDSTEGIFMLDASAVEYTGTYPITEAGFIPFPPRESDPPVINQGQLCPPNCPARSLLDVIDETYPAGTW